MSNGKPPDYDDKTVIIPQPGGRRQAPFRADASPALPPSPSPPAAPAVIAIPGSALVNVGINPLVGAANALLILASQLRDTVSHNDVAGLRQRVLGEIRSFESQAQENGVDPTLTQTSRYILCSLLDEMVVNTVWGSSSIWSSQSLLSTLHNETWGGERFFAILDQLLRDPDANLDLLELMFICINLGFKGQYRVIDRGNEKLDEVQRKIYERLRRRGDPGQEISPNWAGAGGKQRGLRRYVPLWVMLAVAGVLLLAVFLGFSVVLENTTAPTLRALESMG